MTTRSASNPSSTVRNAENVRIVSPASTVSTRPSAISRVTSEPPRNRAAARPPLSRSVCAAPRPPRAAAIAPTPSEAINETAALNSSTVPSTRMELVRGISGGSKDMSPRTPAIAATMPIAHPISAHDRTLRDQLTQQPRRRGTDRSTHRELVLATTDQSERQVRDVRDRHEQQQTDGAQQHEQAATVRRP